MKATILAAAAMHVMVLSGSGRCADSIPHQGDSAIWPHESTLCGPIALYLACRSYGISRYSVQDLAEMASFNAGETSIKGLQEACGKIGLECLPVRTDSRELGRLLGTAPVMRAIVLLTSRHFCYVSSCRDGKFHISRWPFEPEWVTAEQLDRAWAGEALLVSREPIPPSALSPGMKGRGLMFTIAGASMLLVGSIWALCAWRKPRRGRQGSPPA